MAQTPTKVEELMISGFSPVNLKMISLDKGSGVAVKA